MAFFQLGHGRSLETVAGQLDERYSTVKNWSCKYHWKDRIQDFNSGLLARQIQAEAAARQQQTADWLRRSAEYREQQWALAQKLRSAAQCFLDAFGDREVEKMSLGQVSRALQISSRIAEQALKNFGAPEKPGLAPIQLEMMAALERAYAKPLPELDSPESPHPHDPPKI
jgi:hypothetical protein